MRASIRSIHNSPGRKRSPSVVTRFSRLADEGHRTLSRTFNQSDRCRKAGLSCRALPTATSTFMDGSLGLHAGRSERSRSVAEIQKRVKAYADAHPEEPWIQGRAGPIRRSGLRHCPTRRFSMKSFPTVPSIWWHSTVTPSWANSKALAMAGITRNTPDPAEWQDRARRKRRGHRRARRKPPEI